MPLLSPDIFRQILESLPAGVYIVGLDRRIVFWNRAAEFITGYLSQEVIGRSCGEDVLVHCGAEGSPVCSTAGCLLTCALRDRKPSEAVLFARHKDGHRVPIRVKSIPVLDEDGKVLAIAEIFQQQAPGAELHWTGQPPSTHDCLNIPSIAATEAYLETRMKSPHRCAVFHLELEDTRELAQRRGLEMVYAVRRAMVYTAGDLLTTPHFLGHWYDDTFLIVMPNCDDATFREALQQLHGVGNACTIQWWGDRVNAHVRVRGALSAPQESLTSLLARVGQCLHEPGEND
ncbi:MAG TPA: PAS domain-containing protein [Terriglobales bacterium]|nr:PAS domain-containing protein [Terriglobales bacterium]